MALDGILIYEIFLSRTKRIGKEDISTRMTGKTQRILGIDVQCAAAGIIYIFVQEPLSVRAPNFL